MLAATRSVAASLRIDSINDFLRHHITTAANTSAKKSPVSRPKFEKPKQESEIFKSDQQSKTLKEDSQAYYVYCRMKGHTRDDCPKLKKKDQPKYVRPITTVSVSAVVESPPQMSDSRSRNRVASIENKEKIITDSHVIKITEINNSVCNCFALLDTGSPISFISPIAYKNFCTGSIYSVT